MPDNNSISGKEFKLLSITYCEETDNYIVTGLVKYNNEWGRFKANNVKLLGFDSSTDTDSNTDDNIQVSEKESIEFTSKKINLNIKFEILGDYYNSLYTVDIP